MAVFAASAAAMQTPKAPDREPCGHKSAEHRHGVRDAKQTTDLERLKHFAQCARTEGKAEKIRAIIEAVKDQKQEAAELLASITPYAGPNGTRWAIPWYIVACESGGDWGAHNPSGANGPYQLMPATYSAYCEACDWSQSDQHLAAHRLWTSQGSSPWVCA